ncbi:MAG: STAS domain-containing protein [Candidatus Sericytochromatia bacterium]|nr:STAS domain-containing protein [Candidatus Sericytochromatia bacterium]
MTGPFNLAVRKDPQGRYAVLATEGYINNVGGERLGEAANLLMAEGYTRLVINLEKSTVINSIGISILIEVIEKMQESHGALAFCHLTRTIQKTFTIMGLAQYAAVFETEPEAVQALLARA